jgi:hypothetical protein
MLNITGAWSELCGGGVFCAGQRRAADRQPYGCEFCDGRKRSGAAFGNGSGFHSGAFRSTEPDGREWTDRKLRTCTDADEWIGGDIYLPMRLAACERSVHIQPCQRNGGCEFNWQRYGASGDRHLGVVCAHFGTGGMGRGSPGMRTDAGAPGLVTAAQVLFIGSLGIFGNGRDFQLFRFGRQYGRRAARIQQYEYAGRDIFHSGGRRVERGLAYSDIDADRGLDARKIGAGDPLYFTFGLHPERER